MIPLGKARWLGVVTLSLLLHAAAAAVWVATLPDDLPSGGGGIAVSVGSWGGAPAAAPAAAAEAGASALPETAVREHAARAATPLAAPQTAQRVADPGQRPPLAEAADATAEEAAAATANPNPVPLQAEPQDIREAAATPPPAEAQAAPIEARQAERVPVQQEPAPATAPPVPRAPKEPPVRNAQMPAAESPPQAVRTTEARKVQRPGKKQADPSASPARAGPGNAHETSRAGEPGAGGAGSPALHAAGTGAGEADFVARLRAWLAQHQHYPDRARARRQQGTALVSFVMDREGRVLSSRLQQSSGYAMLDREALALLARAEPLPAIPPSLGADRLEIAVPIRFDLQQGKPSRNGG